MGWIDNVASATGWLATEALTGGQSPQQVQQSFQQLGVSSEDFLSWWGYQMQQGNEKALAGFAPGYELLSQWLTSKPGQQAQGPQQAQQTQQALGLGGRPQNLSDAQWQTVQGVLRAAQEFNIPPQLALAMAYKESGFDAGATGDNGCSHGALQLNTCGGEGQGLPEYVLNDPYLNARVSFQHLREVMSQNPGLPLGQLAAMAQRPEDPQGYAEVIGGYIDGAQTGQGPLGWATSSLTGGTGALNRQAGGSSAVPIPFSRDYFQSITQSFGENGEEGTDFGMPEGQPITSPVGGTITTRDDGNRNWGRAVYVKMPNGWTYFVGHLMDFDVQDGQTISPGEVLGTSGGGPNSPSPGESTGPHVEVRFIDPNGQNQDPMSFLNQVFAGTTYAQWAGGAFLGSAQVTGTPQDIRRTPDGRLLDFNSQTGQWYQAVDNVWRSIYGVHAPLQAALDFQAAGIKTVDQIQSAVDNLPSGIISGVTIGAFRSLEGTVNQQAQTSLGRPVPQSLVKELYQQGATTAADVRLWFESHSSSDIPPEQYQQTFDAANQYSQAVWNDYPHPTDVASMWQQAGGVPSQTLPPQDQVAKTIADYVAGVF